MGRLFIAEVLKQMVNIRITHEGFGFGFGFFKLISGPLPQKCSRFGMGLDILSKWLSTVDFLDKEERESGTLWED